MLFRSTVKFYAKSDVLLSMIRITMDGRVYTADVDDDYIRVDGEYYRIYRDRGMTPGLPLLLSVRRSMFLFIFLTLSLKSSLIQS